MVMDMNGLCKGKESKVAQMISQAWTQHENDRKLISLSPKEVFEVLQVQCLQDMEKGSMTLLSVRSTLTPSG